WRELLSRKDEVPTDKTVVVYCDTGLLSSKAHFALSVAGFENVRVLFGGYLKWQEK
ncbi:MAG TPA: rhodanese-like domain-containing protein, partial [Thiomicrospira sp.]|nr:rhodanese-like domain-containing protein [Thiomicrospira sp.]